MTRFAGVDLTGRVLTNVFGAVLDRARFVHLESFWLPFRGEDGAFSRIVAMSAESPLVELRDADSAAG